MRDADCSIQCLACDSTWGFSVVMLTSDSVFRAANSAPSRVTTDEIWDGGRSEGVSCQKD